MEIFLKVDVLRQRAGHADKLLEVSSPLIFLLIVHPELVLLCLKASLMLEEVILHGLFFELEIVVVYLLVGVDFVTLGLLHCHHGQVGLLDLLGLALVVDAVHTTDERDLVGDGFVLAVALVLDGFELVFAGLGQLRILVISWSWWYLSPVFRTESFSIDTS